MGREYVVACALPYSVGAGEAFQVSLFLSPTIETAGETHLGDWELFPDWGAVAAGRLTIQLSDQQGLIECAPLLDPVDPDLWRALFPKDLPVRSAEVPDWSKRRWRTFPARRVHDHALQMHMATIMADPASPPRPGEHPLSRSLSAFARKHKILWTDRATGQVSYDESRATKLLDGVVEGSEELAVVERAVDATGDPLMKLALDLHRCRRFYDRPEHGNKTIGDPEQGARPPALPENKAEFHGRCAALGDHPELLRRLGLVIDLRVLDPERLRRSQWLSASLKLDGRSEVSRSTRVKCRAEGEGFTSEPRTADWFQGALRIGNGDRFSVLTLDTDGSALKADQFLWTLPRLMKVEGNGDPVDAATPAQRSPGFTVAAARQGLRVQGDLARQGRLAAELSAGEVPELSTEDVTRGLRVEVWDSTRDRWFSLHRRRATATVDEFGTVYDARPEEGFIQGTAAHQDPRADQAPVHIHEALFGWEGWSLSVRRAGKRIWEKHGKAELLDEEPEESGPHPFRITSQIERGTLPRLRYGRSYAFRAWAVDLAGNSRPHSLEPGTMITVSPPPEAPPALDTVSRSLLAGVKNAWARRTAEVAGALPSAAAAAAEISPEIIAYVRGRRGAEPGGAMLAAGVGREARVTAAAAEALEQEEGFAFRPGSRVDPVPLIGKHLGTLFPAAEPEMPGLEPALQTVTRPEPFLRWEPVISPAVVPRWRYTEGESLRILVIRSGVTQDPKTLAIAVENAADFAASANALEPKCGYRPTAERHFAPPKVTQAQAELHGMFDQAIGSSDPADHRKMLGWALRADGTFASTERADIDNPGAMIPQPDMSIVQVGAPVVAEQKKSLPITPVGAPLGPGQTIVHDVDKLALPYLPDPLAEGAAIHFPEAGRDWNLLFPHAAEGFTAAFGGTWPEKEPFRFVLESGPSLSGRVDGRLIRMTLAPGDMQELRLSCSLPKQKLDLLGPWSFLPAAMRNDPDIAEAAADGLLWGLSPSEPMTLVHAVNRPIEAPRPVLFRAERWQGQTFATLLGAVDLHGGSTGVLAADASWTEMVDDISLPQPIRRRGSARAFDTIIHSHEDIALLAGANGSVTLPEVGRVDLHRAVHHFSDTRHRRVRYRFRAFTRFREFFHPTLLKDEDGRSTDDMHSVVSPVLRLSVPSSARPAPPVVHSVLPLFRWSDEGEPEQPMARRRVRRAGVRIYLERPWFTSGDGELLGLLLAKNGDERPYPDVEDQSGFPFVSRWGADPIWRARQVDQRALPILRLENFLQLTGLDDRGRAGRPVVPPRDLPLAALEGKPLVTVLGYRPRYNKQRELWFVDVAIDPGPQFWPFLRLAVARYQPESVNECHLSAPVRCDFVQLPPERAASISRTDDRHVRVVVGGPVGTRPVSRRDSWEQEIERNRQVIARLQRRDPAIRSDLGWKTVAFRKLRPLGGPPDRSMATWGGELDAGELLPLRQPGEQGDWRVAVEEWELLDADLDLRAGGTGELGQEARLVYADHLTC